MAASIWRRNNRKKNRFHAKWTNYRISPRSAVTLLNGRKTVLLEISLAGEPNATDRLAISFLDLSLIALGRATGFRRVTTIVLFVEKIYVACHRLLHCLQNLLVKLITDSSEPARTAGHGLPSNNFTLACV